MKDNFNIHGWNLERALKETEDPCWNGYKQIGMKEKDSKQVSNYVPVNEASNPEGDELVLRFLKGIAKKFDYSIEDAVRFVKERIKSLGY